MITFLISIKQIQFLSLIDFQFRTNLFADFEWIWDNPSKSAASFLKHDQREVVFHVDYSCGTAAVRGSQPMIEDQYYWEVKMTTPVYGTDMVKLTLYYLMILCSTDLFDLMLISP